MRRCKRYSFDIIGICVSITELIVWTIMWYQSLSWGKNISNIKITLYIALGCSLFVVGYTFTTLFRRVHAHRHDDDVQYHINDENVQLEGNLESPYIYPAEKLEVIME